MSLIEIIRQIDWQDANKKIAAETLFADAKEYITCVEKHIYKGNDIRADMWMDHTEKQDELSRLDRKRTEAHDRMLTSFNPFLDILKASPDFEESKYNLSNRTRIADFVATIIFEIMGAEPRSQKEGEIRDELAEKIHLGEITFEQIFTEIQKIVVK